MEVLDAEYKTIQAELFLIEYYIKVSNKMKANVHNQKQREDFPRIYEFFQ